MNIFAIYDNPETSARHLCDQHTIKMIIESAQLLANAFSLDRLSQSDCPRTKKGDPRRHSHVHHPSTLWTIRSRGNFEWVLRHALELVREKQARYPKSPIHFTNDFLLWVEKHMGELNFPFTDLQEFSIAISDDKECRKNHLFESSSVVDKYRLYYKYDKKFATWKRNKPEWMF